MVNSHIALGIAQTVFYIPAVFVAIYLAIRHARSKQRMWWSLTLFTLSEFTPHSLVNKPSSFMIQYVLLAARLLSC